MKIEVTQEDIDNGEANDPQSCPVALAIRRTGLSKWGVDVFTDEIIINVDRQSNMHYRTTDVVRTFIEDFDSEIEVQPFSFTLGEE